jgi:hypothetical protein
MHEGRQHARRAVALRPRYRVATELAYTESACLDLSEGGMFIESSEPAKPGTWVKLECSGEGGAFRGLGKVAWRRPQSGKTPGGMGIRFLKLEGDGGDVVQRLLASARDVRPSTPSVATTSTAPPLPVSRSPLWLTLAALLAMLVGAAIVLIGSR